MVVLIRASLEFDSPPPTIAPIFGVCYFFDENILTRLGRVVKLKHPAPVFQQKFNKARRKAGWPSRDPTSLWLMALPPGSSSRLPEAIGLMA